jgi:transposase
MDIQTAQSTLPNPIPRVLYLAFELGQKQYKLGFTTGLGQQPRLRTITARDTAALQLEIQLARQRFSLPETASVLSCYEAGRDGFWLHRYLQAHGIANLVVDSASIEVNRRARRTKTDRLDVGKLLTMLIRYHLGEHQVWRIVNIPEAGVEDSRHLHRELASLKRDRTRHINRIKGSLAGQGVSIPVNQDFLDQLSKVRLWNGQPLSANLCVRLEREFERMELVNRHIGILETQRRELIRTSDQPCIEQVRQLLSLRGIGVNSAWLFVMEFFSWRAFHNRREIGALAGLTPTPYQSGDANQEQGISKAGNRHIRALAIEIAWGWLRFQPTSELSQWYQKRFGSGSSRIRRIGIVALARRLLVELWRYLETNQPPTGAVVSISLR